MTSFQSGFKYFPFKEIALIHENFSTLSGVRIVQLSDLHLNKKVDLSYLKQLVQKINDLKPDIVVFTGDILQTSAYKIKNHLKLFTDIKAKKYYVTGNHDLVYGTKELRYLMEDAGVICLDNSISTLDIQGNVLQLVGQIGRASCRERV